MGQLVVQGRTEHTLTSAPLDKPAKWMSCASDEIGVMTLTRALSLRSPVDAKTKVPFDVQFGRKE